MAETMNRDGKKIFADKIRMLAKSIYDAADDIAGTTDGCVEIEVSFNIETETDSVEAEFPTYVVTRRHYPQRKLVEEFFERMHDTSEHEEERPVLSIDSDPVAYKEMLDKEIERAKTAALFPTHVTLSHDEALRILGRCCETCKYSNDIENPICDGCIHGDHVHNLERRECWEDYDDDTH